TIDTDGMVLAQWQVSGDWQPTYPDSDFITDTFLIEWTGDNGVFFTSGVPGTSFTMSLEDASNAYGLGPGIEATVYMRDASGTVISSATTTVR
ncbi:MAG: hypothetical protein AAF125_22010, partial [Chloroflexota bacterium]